MIKSRRMSGWGVQEMRNAYKVWSEILKGRDHLEHQGIDRRIILKWTSKK
jgi:hypothetical protein